MSQPSIDHTKLLALDVEPKQNPTRGPLDIAQKKTKLKRKQKKERTNTLQERAHGCNHINTHIMHIQNSKV
jgi:hypothetical protein